MACSLTAYLEELRALPAEPDYEPEMDDKDEKADKNLRELEDLEAGAVLRGNVESGEGTDTPAEGDLVYVHVSVRTLEDELLETTRSDAGGSGSPKAFVLGKGLRAPRGWELILQDMTRGERCVARLQPSYSYWHPSCQLPPPPGAAAPQDLAFDLQLVAWYPKIEVQVLGERGDMFKRTLHAGRTWETPRAPFEVHVECSAHLPSTSGRHAQGPAYWATAPSQPLRFTMGTGAVPTGLELGLTSVAEGERAVIGCPASVSAGGPVPAPPPGAERVEFEVHLVSMLQVRDLVGNGQVTKRRVRPGQGEFPIDCPLEDSTVRVHFRGYFPGDGDEFVNTRGPEGDAPPVEFESGMDAVPEAIDMAVRLMTPGELSIVRSSAHYAYDGRPDRPKAVLEGAEVEWELELVSFEQQPNWAVADVGARISRADALRAQGNALFKRALWRQARLKYTKAQRILDRMFDVETDEEATAASNAKVACLVNLAAVAQREGQAGEAISWCDKALREQPNHAKALYRRATARASLNDYKLAQEDFAAAKLVDPAVAEDVDREVQRMHARRRAGAVKQRQQFRSFFNRGS